MTSRDALEVLLEELVDRVAARVAPASTEHVYEDELVQALGSRERAKRLIKAGSIEGSVIGRRLIASRRSFDTFIASNRVRPIVRAPRAAETDAEDLEGVLARAGTRVVGGRR